MVLIGIAGRIGSGKDTVADELVEKHGFMKMPFAGPLKTAAKVLFGFSEEQMNDRELKECVNEYWGITHRSALQKLGTECMRGVFGQDFWLKRWMLGYHTWKDTDHIVVPDVRFENEANLIRNFNGMIIHIRRPHNPNGIPQTHASEAGIAIRSTDIVIDNVGELKQLRECASGIGASFIAAREMFK